MGQPRFPLKLIGFVADIAQLDQQNASHKSTIALDNRQWLFSIGFEIIHVVNDS